MQHSSLTGSLKAASTPAKPSAPRFVKAPQMPHLVPHLAFLAKAAGKQQPAFVRPDLPPEDFVAPQPPAPASPWPRVPSSPWPRAAASQKQGATNNIVDKSALESRLEERIHFRSALEQVSYSTNKNLMGSTDEEPKKKKGGLFGLRK